MQQKALVEHWLAVVVIELCQQWHNKGRLEIPALQYFQSTLDLQKFRAYPIFMQGTPKLIKMQKKHNL
jgi:hypothetical protein